MEIRASFSTTRVVSIAAAWIMTTSLCPRASAQVSVSSWRQTENAPSGVFETGWGTVSLPDGNVMGVGTAGDGHTSLGFIYHSDTNRWSTTASVPGVIALGSSLAALRNGTVLAFGVSTSDRKIKAEIFSPTSNQWHEAGQLPVDIGWEWKVVRLSDTRFLMLSGQPGAQWLYDTDKEVWSKTPDVPVKTSGIEYTFSIDAEHALVVFRDTTLSGHWLGMVYDSAHDVWLPTKPMPNKMRSAPRGSKMLPDGSFLMIGYQESPSIATVPIIFHPRDRSWTTAGELPDESFNAHVAALLPGGKVLAIDPVSVGKVRSLVFDPDRRTWRVDGALPYGYQGVTNPTPLKDGTLWAMGYRNNVDRDELVYAPSTGTWTVRPMPRGAVDICPLSASDGSVLLFLSPNTDMRSLIQGAVLFRP